MKLKRIILLVLLCASLLALPAFVGGIAGNSHTQAAQTAFVGFSGCTTEAPTTTISSNGNIITLPICVGPTTNLVGWNS